MRRIIEPQFSAATRESKIPSGKAIAMCGSVRRILRSRLFLQLYNTRRHWRVSVSGLESSAVRGKGRGRKGEEEEKKRQEKEKVEAHTAAQGEREDDPFSSASSNCSGIQDTLRSWAGDARARAKRADSSFESPIAPRCCFDHCSINTPSTALMTI